MNISTLFKITNCSEKEPKMAVRKKWQDASMYNQFVLQKIVYIIIIGVNSLYINAKTIKERVCIIMQILSAFLLYFTCKSHNNRFKN